jgi:chemotaxis protein histidine kinase CheA/ActR/RegA family two-component response regulator
MQPEQQQRIMGYFIEEAKDHLNTIEQGLLNLQSTIDDPEMVNEVFRAAHSVKGGAAMLGLSSIQQTSHRLEDFFKILKENTGIKPDQKLESLLLRVFDTLQDLLEQLQGPFGLVAETANEAVANVEPIFVELQNHLNQLASQSAGSSPVASFDEDTVSFSPVSPRVESQALRVIFQNEVSARLREMLQLFKQAEMLPDGRAQLQASCLSLSQVGQQFNLRPWCDLVEAARQAIADPGNSCRVLAAVIIRDLKQAQNLVLEGQGENILASQQLRDLLPITGMAGIAANDEIADFFAVTDSLPDDDLSLLDLDFAGLSDNASGSSDRSEVDASLFGDAGLAAAEVDDILSDRNGPEVGMAELNSLADLFEGEMPELGATWQEEIVVGNPQTDVFADFNVASFQDATDFSDLFDETTPRTAPPQTAADDLESLFSDDSLLSDDLLADSSLGSLASSSPLGTDTDRSELDVTDFSFPENNDLAVELDDFGELNLDEFEGLGGSDEISLINREESNARNSEAVDDLDNLGELFAGLDDTDLVLADAAMTFSDALPAEEAADLSLGDLDFDSLMSESDASDAATLSGLSAFANSTLPTGDDLMSLVADPWSEGEQTETMPPGLTDRDFSSLELATEESTELLSGFPGTLEDNGDDLLFGDLLTEAAVSTGDDLDESSNLGFGELDAAFAAPPNIDEFGNFDNLFGDRTEQDLFGDVMAEEPASELDAANLAGLGLGETAETDLEEFLGLGENFDLNLAAPSAIVAESVEALNFDATDLSALEIALDNPGDESDVSGLEDLLGDDFNPEDDLLADLESPINNDQGLVDPFSELELAAADLHLTDEPALNLAADQFGFELSDADVTTDLGLTEEPALSLEDEMLGITAPSTEDAATALELGDLDLGDPGLDGNFDQLFIPDSAAEVTTWGDRGDSDMWDTDVATDLTASDLDLGNDLDMASTGEEELSLDFSESAGEANFDDLFGDAAEVEDDLSSALADPTSLFDSEMAFPEADAANSGDFDDLFGESAAPAADNDLSGWLGAGLVGAAGVAAGALAGRAHDNQGDGDAIDALADGFDELDDLLADETPDSSDLTTANEFGDLGDLLDEPTSADALTDPNLAGLGEFDALLDESSTDAGVEFAGLDALLDDETPARSSVAFEDFSDLEALLADAPEAVVVTTQVGVSDSGDSEFDDLEKMLEDADMTMGGSPTVKNRGATPVGRRPTRPGKVFSEQTMRVPVKHLDNLSNLVGELVVNRNSLEQDQERLRQSLDNLLYQVQQLSDVGQRMQDLYERSLLESSLLASRQNHRDANNAWLTGGRNMVPTEPVDAVEYDPLEMDRFTGFHSLSQEMIELIVRVRESASDIEFIVDETDQVTRMFRQVTTQLQEGLTRSRMVPFAQTADRLPRAVRDIAVKCGKQAELVIEGRETLIDKMILEHLYDPMTHLVNNALTHGIETPDIRQAAGKQSLGRITIRAFHQGNQTVISVSDDGAGIDIERVRVKAIEKGLITPAEARTMTKLDLYDLLFHPGFSTKDQADDFAGRGVGMDVVRTSLSEIRGAITTDSSQGKGTTFTIRLPLTLSISKALCCISDRARIAFPMDGVEDMLDIPKERVQTNTEGQPCLSWRDALLPLRPLTELLGYNRHLSRGNVYGGNQEDDMVSVVILRSAGNYLALEVDQVLGEQEIVIKQLEGPIPKPVGVAGATVLGDGRIMPIADVLELIDLSMGRIRRDVGTMWDQGGAALSDQPIKTEPTVLIVDDSITVRELLSMTFNKVGYRVEQARDGQEAWEKLRAGLPCDIVFCDIEMPRMDGLELLSRIQKDPNLSHLPIAMLTSRGADRHRQMASSLGASGYFTKPYLEEALLDAAQRMLKGEVLISVPRERES